MAILLTSMLPQMATTCFMTEVAKNRMICNSIENLSHFFLPFLAIFCFTKLPQMATTCFMTEVAKNGNKWLHIIAKNGNKRNDLQLYREHKSLFCHFWHYFAFSSVIMLSKNCQKWQMSIPESMHTEEKPTGRHIAGQCHTGSPLIQARHFPVDFDQRSEHAPT